MFLSLFMGDGNANAASTVTVNSQSVQRQGDLFFTQIPVDNSSSPVYSAFTVVGARTNADAQGNDAVQQSTVKRVVAQTPETFTYDFDGNVLSDGRWNYTWDGENRLVSATSLNSVPSVAKKKLDFIYDGQSRRVSKKVYAWDSQASAYSLQTSSRFLYDQFNLLTEIKDDGSVINSYAWGTDLSGSLYGAGGVGGLLITTNASGNFYPGLDANGNVIAYVSQSGSVTCQMEYGPFGELIRMTGTPPCSFGFSTKYRDSETGLNYYGYRYYNPNLGRWLGRDPLGERGGKNLFGFCMNNGIMRIDVNGLWFSDGLAFLKWLIDFTKRPLHLDWNDFDDDGAPTRQIKNDWKRKNYERIKGYCRQSWCGFNSFGGSEMVMNSGYPFISEHGWISGYTASAQEHSGIDIEKDCSNCSYKITVILRLDAWDVSDFNKDDEFQFGPFTLQDNWFIDLRDETPVGYDYPIDSYTYSTLKFTLKEPL